MFDLEISGVDTTTDRIVRMLDKHGYLTADTDWMFALDGWEIADVVAATHGVSTEHARANGRPAVQVTAEIWPRSPPSTGRLSRTTPATT
ncbi:hypothetical protein MMX123_02024 [Microbacterium sp. MM2322]|uniref:hypothetical protein n=1 Tax=Microbacterium sp. MM2322 TaxID=3157631 RepID=UPI003D8027EC